MAKRLNIYYKAPEEPAPDVVAIEQENLIKNLEERIAFLENALRESQARQARQLEVEEENKILKKKLTFFHKQHMDTMHFDMDIMQIEGRPTM